MRASGRCVPLGGTLIVEVSPGPGPVIGGRRAQPAPSHLECAPDRAPRVSVGERRYHASVSSKPKRARAARREQERQLKKGVRQRERVAVAAPAGSPEQALSVSSASVVEIRARAMPCPQCGGAFDIEAHEADVRDGDLLRVVRVTCRLCHVRRKLWFKVEPPLAN